MSPLHLPPSLPPFFLVCNHRVRWEDWGLRIDIWTDHTSFQLPTHSSSLSALFSCSLRSCINWEFFCHWQFLKNKICPEGNNFQTGHWHGFSTPVLQTARQQRKTDEDNCEPRYFFHRKSLDSRLGRCYRRWDSPNTSEFLPALDCRTRLNFCKRWFLCTGHSYTGLGPGEWTDRQGVSTIISSLHSTQSTFSPPPNWQLATQLHCVMIWGLRCEVWGGQWEERCEVLPDYKFLLVFIISETARWWQPQPQPAPQINLASSSHCLAG